MNIQVHIIIINCYFNLVSFPPSHFPCFFPFSNINTVKNGVHILNSGTDWKFYTTIGKEKGWGGKGER